MRTSFKVGGYTLGLAPIFAAVSRTATVDGYTVALAGDLKPGAPDGGPGDGRTAATTERLVQADRGAQYG
jgi:hypothetical protein